MTLTARRSFSLRQMLHNLPWGAIGSVMLAFLITRVLILLVTYLSMIQFPIRLGDYWRVMPRNLIVDGLVRWDSGFFRDIVLSGYQNTPDFRYAPFFPFYPMLVWGVSQLIGRVYISGLLVSNLMFLIALGYLYPLTRQEFGEEAAGRTVFYLAAAPAAFVFSVFYSESTFIALLIASIYYARNRHWGLAATAGAAASATQVTGFLVAVFIGIEGLLQQGFVFFPRPWNWPAQWNVIKQNIKIIPHAYLSLLAAVGTAAGWLSYMVFQQRIFGDPWAFVHTQLNWGRQLSWDWLPRLVQNTVLHLHIHGSLLAGQINADFLQDLVAAMIFLPLVIAVVIKMRPSYGFFSIMMFLIGPITGDLGSMRRYVLWLIPCYMLLGVLGKRQWLDRLILVFSLCLQTYLTILFTHWYFAG